MTEEGRENNKLPTARDNMASSFNLKSGSEVYFGRCGIDRTKSKLLSKKETALIHKTSLSEKFQKCP